LRYYPDKNQGATGIESKMEKFKVIENAHELLAGLVLKRDYDREQPGSV